MQNEVRIQVKCAQGCLDEVKSALADGDIKRAVAKLEQASNHAKRGAKHLRDAALEVAGS